MRQRLKWLHRAAHGGRSVAQHTLGILYRNGKDVPEDLVQAHLWFSLAAAQGSLEAELARDEIAAKMTPAQIAEAQLIASEWAAKK